MFFCLVAPIATTFIILQYQKKLVKSEMKLKLIAEIDKGELVLLKFTENEKNNWIKWEHSKEFEYKGEMYDIVESEVKGDTTYYWCWPDCEETKLNIQLDQLVSFAWGNNPDNQENQKRLSKFIEHLYFSEPTEITTLAFQTINNKHLYQQNYYQSISNTPPVPPP